MAQATLQLLNDAELLAETRRKAYQYARPMFWPNIGRQYLDYFAQAVTAERMESAEPFRRGSSFDLNPLSAPSLLPKGT